MLFLPKDLSFVRELQWLYNIVQRYLCDFLLCKVDALYICGDDVRYDISCHITCLHATYLLELSEIIVGMHEVIVLHVIAS